MSWSNKRVQITDVKIDTHGHKTLKTTKRSKLNVVPVTNPFHSNSFKKFGYCPVNFEYFCFSLNLRFPMMRKTKRTLCVNLEKHGLRL